MFWFTVVVCCLGLVASQHDPFHQQLISLWFMRIDASPHDGHMTEAEFTAQIPPWDLDNDGCVTMAEFKATHIQLVDSTVKAMFNTMDVDLNNCINTGNLQALFRRMDVNGNDQLTLTEFDKLLEPSLDNLVIG